MGKLNYRALLNFFILKLNFIQTLVWPVLYVYHVTGSLLTSPAAPLLICLTTQQTDWQYSHYGRNIKGCLSSEIIYIEYDTLVGLSFSTVFKNLKYSHKKNYLAHQLASNTEFRQLHSLKTLHCNNKLFFAMYLHLCLGYSSIEKTHKHSIPLLLSVVGMFVCTAIYRMMQCL